MAMTETWTYRIMTAAIAVLSVSGCASEDSMGRFLVEPDRYVLYNCTELATAVQANVNRQHELELLIAKAGSGTGGQLASNVAYRPEYVQLHGEMTQLRKAAADKNCKFMPAGVPASLRASDHAVR
jgi:hypothetical protein